MTHSPSRKRLKYITENIRNSELSLLLLSGYIISEKEYNVIKENPKKLVSKKTYKNNIKSNYIFYNKTEFVLRDSLGNKQTVSYYNNKNFKSSFRYEITGIRMTGNEISGGIDSKSIQKNNEYTYASKIKSKLSDNYTETEAYIQEMMNEKSEHYDKIGFLLIGWIITLRVYTHLGEKTYNVIQKNKFSNYNYRINNYFDRYKKGELESFGNP